MGIMVSDQSLSKHTKSHKKALRRTIKEGKKSWQLQALRKEKLSAHKEPLRAGLREGERGLKHLWAQGTSIGLVKME